MLEQIRENSRQIDARQVPVWINDTQLEYLTSHTNDKITRCQIRKLKVWKDQECVNTGSMSIGVVLGIPVILRDKLGMQLYKVENTGVIRGKDYIKYNDILPYVMEMLWKLEQYCPLSECSLENQVVICPHPIDKMAESKCGFNATVTCTMKTRKAISGLTHVAYMGKGRYCLTSTAKEYQYGHKRTWPVSNSTFWVNPPIPTRVGKMELVQIHKQKTETITVTESIKEDLTIQPLPTRLGKERQQLEVIAVVYYNLEQQSKMQQDEIDEINDSTWQEDLWNWGSDVQIHPWFRIIFHVLIVVLGIMVLYVTYLIWQL
ncbi:uncharacterized protein [Heterodontus francisci]|uniref:uncharacterized protein n=1 Tax=Heterodontus francisci TaxID=7792 RepID=UPI00355B3BB0